VGVFFEYVLFLALVSGIVYVERCMFSCWVASNRGMSTAAVESRYRLFGQLWMHFMPRQKLPSMGPLYVYATSVLRLQR
jgi:hypothetical protein